MKPTAMAQQMPISMAIRKTEIDVARKAIAVESEVKVTATAPEAKRSMNPSRGSSPALRGTRKYECMTSIPSMPMARPIDAPKMWPKKTYGKSRHEMPKVAMTARLATRKTSAGSRRSASARGSTSLPSVEWCAKARTTRMMSTVKASGRHMSMGGKSSIANSVMGCDWPTHEIVSSGYLAAEAGFDRAARGPSISMLQRGDPQHERPPTADG